MELAIAISVGFASIALSAASTINAIYTWCKMREDRVRDTVNIGCENTYLTFIKPIYMCGRKMTSDEKREAMEYTISFIHARLPCPRPFKEDLIMRIKDRLNYIKAKNRSFSFSMS